MMVKELKEKYESLKIKTEMDKEIEEQKEYRIRLLAEEKKKLQIEVMKAKMAAENVRQL